jgi:hypothetical protein
MMTKSVAGPKTKKPNSWSNKHAITALGLVMLVLSLQTLFVGAAFAESAPKVWSPDPHFRIEQRSYQETLIFIAGISYALTSSNAELKRLGKKNFFCMKDAESVGSKLLIDILNEKYTGSITSEQAIENITEGLKKRYPCH